MYQSNNITSIFLGKYTKSFSLLLCLLAPLAAYAGGDRIESPELFSGSANESSTFGKPSRSRAESNEVSSTAQQRSAEPVAKTRIIVKFRPGTSQQKRVQMHAEMGVLLNHQLRVLNDFDIIELSSGQDVADVIKRYQQQYEISYAEPDMQVNTMSIPNDPSYSELWGLNNNMQTGGTVNADINAPEAWDLTTGSASVVVAVIDTGVDYNHPDLAANMWVNPGEIAGDNIDNDGNGYVDDIYGIDTANDDSDPFDDAGHGTHVAGTIGAVGNNNLGVVGVNHQTSIIACKFLSASGGGSTSNAIKCLDYMLDLKKNRGVNLVITNNSWGGGGFSQALYDAIKKHADESILFAAAAGNSSNNNDGTGSYPATYDLANIISVAATDHNDSLAYFSSYGKKTVDVAAPGVNILSTTPNNSYASYNGTSMATPQVAGLIALTKAYDPSLTSQQLKSLIMVSGDLIPSLSDKVLSGRRIKAWGSVDINGAAKGALTCQNQLMSTRLAPLNDTVLLSVGSILSLEYTELNCSDHSTSVTVTVAPSNLSITLDDSGTNGDQVAGDGILGGQFVLADTTNYSLTFPDSSVVSVKPIRNYEAVKTVTYAYEQITGTRLNMVDETKRKIQVPFPVNYGGFEVGSSLWVHDNGTIGIAADYTPWRNKALPNNAFSSATIVPLWDDWFLGYNSEKGVFWQVTGNAPNRRLVIEWRAVQHYNLWGSNMDYATFQVILYESSSDIRVNYKDVDLGNASYSNGASATIGVQHSPTIAQQYSLNAANISSQQSLLWEIDDPDRVKINGISLSGNLKVGQSVGFAITATPSAGHTITQYDIDFNGDSSFDYTGTSSVTQHIYTAPGIYSYKVKVTDSNNASAELTGVVTIIDLTLSEKLVKAVSDRDQQIIADPTILNLFNQSNVDTQLNDRDAQIRADPAILDLVSKAQIEITTAKVAALDSKWHLLANALPITDPVTRFASTQIVLYYLNDAYYAYSPNTDTQLAIAQSGILAITTVPAGVGLWIKK